MPVGGAQRECAKRSWAFLAGGTSLRRTAFPATPPECGTGAGGEDRRTTAVQRTQGTTEAAGAPSRPTAGDSPGRGPHAEGVGVNAPDADAAGANGGEPRRATGGHEARGRRGVTHQARG